MDVHPWMLLVPPALSAGAVPLARRHPVAAWVVWAVLAVVSVAGVVLFAAGVAFLQTFLGSTMDVFRGVWSPDRRYVDLWFLAPWVATTLIILGVTAAALVRRRRGR